jgi:hypothetical protein
LAGFWLALLGGLGTVQAAEATLNVEVPGGKWKGMRLKNLPQGAKVALQIESSGALRVIVLDSSELKRFPNTRALFTGSVEKRLGFSVVIPRSGDYFIVFDNRAGSEPRQVTIRIRAQPPRRRESPPRDDSLERT